MPYDNIMGTGKFACGKTTYARLGNTNDRMLLHVNFGGKVSTFAVLDTGTHWCILNPEHFEAVEGTCESYQSEDWRIRGETYSGRIYRMPIYLDSEEGEGLEVEGSVFIPTLRPGQKYEHPDFIGLIGFLERIRYAIDPEESKFYFGKMED
jgi:hypothetical protein